MKTPVVHKDLGRISWPTYRFFLRELIPDKPLEAKM